MESFSKVVAILIGVILMFLSPILSISLKQDSIAQTIVDSETENFVESIKYSGYISREMYFAYVKKIETTGNIYDISICHSKKVITPGYNELDVVSDGSFNTFYNNVYEDAIMDSFESGENYELNQGDYISITVTNRNRTIGSRVLSALTFLSIDNKILSVYGGMIRDELD